SISMTVSGAGVLAEEEALDITVPAKVEITEYLVSNGDYVKKGQPVARVDTISAYSAAGELAETLESIEEDLAEIQNTAVSTSINCNVAGKLTAMYADVGDDIRQVMAEYGALAEITMDNGTVLRVSGTSGTIKESPLQLGWDVYDGAVLYRIQEADATGEYGNLVLKHQKYETMMAQLFQMIRDGYAVAPGDGIVSGIDESLLHKSFSAEHPEPSPSVMLSEEPEQINGPGRGERGFPEEREMPPAEKAGGESSGGNSFDMENGADGFAVEAAGSSEASARQLTTLAYVVSPLTDDGISDGSSETTSSYLFGKITSAVDGNGMANVEVTDSDTGETETICVDLSAFDKAKKGYYVCVQMDTTTTNYTDGSDPTTEISYTVLLATEISMPTGGGGGSSGRSSGSGNSGTSYGSSVSASSGSSGTQTAGNSTGSTTENLYSLSTTVIASVVPTDSMVIGITVDELDILSISRGDKAVVTIDALPGRSFDGTVTGVNTGSSNNGGNSKYLAEITIAREEDFIAGMNASGIITLETVDNTLAVPTAALNEFNGRTVVYISADESTGELSESVEVKTGVSDGEMTEIISGLQEDDEYWYVWYETDRIGDLRNASSGGGLFGGFGGMGGRQGRRR
ncbi:MAG: HlyD family efflux transporter periplasmic adaptor subunit, partial [Oscillospiraceae bacterium]|nr:HlyD family efflux transporter periplasmic adaptor subunit [Oscillospiraceae bacterium]